MVLTRWPALDEVLTSSAEWTLRLSPTAKYADQVEETEVAAEEISDAADLMEWARDELREQGVSGVVKIWLEACPQDEQATEERDALRRRHGPGCCRKCISITVDAQSTEPTRARARARAKPAATSDEAEQIRARTEALRAKAELLEAERELERRMRAGDPEAGEHSILRELLAELREARRTPPGGLGVLVQLLPVVTPIIEQIMSRAAEREAALISAIGQIGSRPIDPMPSSTPAAPVPLPEPRDPIDSAAKVLPLITQLVELARELGGGGGERSLVGEVADAIKALQGLGAGSQQPRPVVIRPAPSPAPQQQTQTPAGEVTAGDDGHGRRSPPGPETPTARTAWPPPPSHPAPNGEVIEDPEVERNVAEVVGRARLREWIAIVAREAAIGSEPSRVAEEVVDGMELLPATARQHILAAEWDELLSMLDDVPPELRAALASPDARSWCEQLAQALRELLLETEGRDATG